MPTRAEDRRHIPGAGTPITIPSGSATVNLAALFANCPDYQAAPYARAIVNPSPSATLTVTAVRIDDANIASPGVTTGCTMALQPGEKWFGQFITLLSSSSSGQTVNVER